jgi:hypothetical protein
MATTTTTTTTVTSSPASTTADEQPLVYGCVHVESILKKHGARIRREYDSAMSVVIQSSRAKTSKVKVLHPLREELWELTGV